MTRPYCQEIVSTQGLQGGLQQLKIIDLAEIGPEWSKVTTISEFRPGSFSMEWDLSNKLIIIMSLEFFRDQIPVCQNCQKLAKDVNFSI